MHKTQVAPLVLGISLFFSAGFFISTPIVHAGELAETELSQADTDRLVDDLFARQRKLRWLKAKVVTAKSGGVFSRGRKSVGQLEAAVPARFRFLDQGDPDSPLPPEQASLMLFDGEFYWEMEPYYEGEPRRIERRTLKKASAEGRGVDLVSFFIGRDVASASELRQDFDILAWQVSDSHGELNHLRLTPRDGETQVELWFRPNAAVPEKVRIAETVRKVGVDGKPGKTSLKITERELSEVLTNLDGLAAFPADTFIFPLKPGQEILDEAGRAIPEKTLREDLERRRQASANE